MMMQPEPLLPGSDGPEVRGVRLTFDGEVILCTEGQTIAAALLATGRRAWRFTPRRKEPRGLFCGMGVCFDCLAQVDGRPNVRACLTPAAEAMRVETQHGAGSWEAPP
ncbi:MAG TPA: (2Fe-2S)-binding protein [Pirellulales bacterium]|nr:(2Fe-2S)-binding protein [Pirellulales bacterium]